MSNMTMIAGLQKNELPEKLIEIDSFQLEKPGRIHWLMEEFLSVAGLIVISNPFTSPVMPQLLSLYVPIVLNQMKLDIIQTLLQLPSD